MNAPCTPAAGIVVPANSRWSVAQASWATVQSKPRSTAARTVASTHMLVIMSTITRARVTGDSLEVGADDHLRADLGSRSPPARCRGTLTQTTADRRPPPPSHAPSADQLTDRGAGRGTPRRHGAARTS